MNTVESRPVTAALLAKAALKRLVQSGLEPTPENYARAWAQECGSTPPRASAAASAAAPVAAPDAAARGQVWAALIERLVAGVERGGRQWTQGRRKDSLQRVLQGSRSDGERLLQRLQALVQAWQADKPADASDHAAPDERAAAPSAAGSPTSGDTRADAAGARGAARADPAQVVAAQLVSAHEAPHDRSARRAMGTLAQALGSALPAGDARAGELADRLSRLADRLAAEGANDVLVLELDRICADARRWFGHRHQLVEQLGGLCRELTRGLTELAEDDSWARGQCAGLEARLAEGLSLRALRAASQLLDETRRHQQRLRGERSAARDALKQLLARMLSEVGELGQHAGVFELAVQGHAEAIARAESVESLAGVVQAMLEDSRTVRASIGASRARLHEQQARAGELEERVRALESELRRISDEAATDALTQVANRRGLEQQFAAEVASCERSADRRLALGLIDLDHFKKLNDRLGHAVGDQALRALAGAVRERLRPGDHVARFGGEEFVLLLPDTELDAAQQALTRLQRGLTASLFMHEGEEVFVTFSAGVTLWRRGETLDAVLARADEALYEAKRTGRNRTCCS